jgi:cation diffusion facilitator family transporter
MSRDREKTGNGKARHGSSASAFHPAAVGEKSRIALFSLAAAFFLTVLKLIVGIGSNSLGVLSEALHSAIDLLAAAVSFAAVRIAAIPADENHPYGHGKVEHLAALAETGLLLLTCGWIIGEALNRLLYKETAVIPSIWAVGVMLVSVAVDLSRAHALRGAAKKHRSQALEADALHFAGDVWSSCAVLAGLAALYFSQSLAPGTFPRRCLEHADTFAALAVAAIVLNACRKLAKAAVDGLMDREHGVERQRILDCLRDMPGIVEVKRLRTRISGPAHFVDLTIAVDGTFGLNAAHDTAHQAEEAVMRLLPDSDVTVHVEPARLPEDRRPDFALVGDLARVHALSARSVLFSPLSDGAHMEMHVEAPAELSLAEAHARVDALEAEVREKLPVTRIVTRLEPMFSRNEARTFPPPEEEIRRAQEAVTRAMAELPMLSHRHDFVLLEEKAGHLRTFSLSLHCRMPGSSGVLRAHDAAAALECLLRRMTEGRLGRVMIHIEPEKENAA